MSRFSNLLNKPLPSQIVNYISESEDFDKFEEGLDDMNLDMAQPGSEVECGDNGSSCEHGEPDDLDGLDLDDLEGEDDDFDPDDMSDSELAALDAELGGDAVDTVIDNHSSDDDEEVDLSPREEMEADDLMSMAATSMLVNDELSTEEKAEFVKTEAAIAVEEGFMTESDVNQLAIETGLVQEARYNNRMIIKLDAASKKKQLYALAVNVCAASHRDPDYVKLKKVMKIRKILRAKLDRKYHTEATKRMKIYYARLRHSKSGMLSKIASKHV